VSVHYPKAAANGRKCKPLNVVGIGYWVSGISYLLSGIRYQGMKTKNPLLPVGKSGF